jgi:curved DNA-binding protein CbpA
VELNWYNSKDELTKQLNGGEKGRQGLEKISNFQYFGHGVEGTLITQYNKENLSKDEIANISRSAFMPNATSKSWGCNTGTGGESSFAQAWANRFNHPMRALIGRSDYAPVGSTRNPAKRFWNWAWRDNLPIEGMQNNNKDDSFWHTFTPQTSQP